MVPNKMATTDSEGNNVPKCPPPACLNICACGPLICMCSAPSPAEMRAMDQEGNILPRFSSTKLSVLLPPSPPPRASASGPAPTPCTRRGVLPAAVSPPLSPLLVSDFTKVYDIAVKTKRQLDSAQMNLKKMSKVLKSRKRRGETMLSMPSAAQTQRIDEVSSLSNSWTNLLVQLRSQSSSQIQEMRATIAEKDLQLKHQKRDIERLTTKVATLTHDNNLAHLSLQQNMSTYSSSITGSVFDTTMSDSVTETLENISPDVTLPSPTEIARRLEENNQISRMLDSVDKLAKQYSPQDRYHQPSNTNLSQSRSAVVPDSLFNFELAGLWMFAEDPTEEEMTQYDRHLVQELRPPPIHSPHLRRPYVNWTTLNKHRRKNLPDPQLFPLYSVPAVPTFYTDRDKYKPADDHINLLPGGLFATKQQCGCAACLPPFGYQFGLMTDMGVIGMPTDPVHGYCWDDDTGGWVIATGCC